MLSIFLHFVWKQSTFFIWRGVDSPPHPLTGDMSPKESYFFYDLPKKSFKELKRKLGINIFGKKRFPSKIQFNFQTYFFRWLNVVMLHEAFADEKFNWA